MMVPVRSLAEVQGLDAGKLNTAALNRVCRELGTECVMVFIFEYEGKRSGSFDTERSESTVHVRMFALAVGGAGGSGYGQRQRRVGGLPGLSSSCTDDRTDHPHSWRVGPEINRPSAVYVEVDSGGEKITAVGLGGQVVLVAGGVVRFRQDRTRSVQ
jgi:predicted PhzF superfamily epimerase YddE/YHI9